MIFCVSINLFHYPPRNLVSMADYEKKHASATTTIFLLAFFLLSLCVAGDSPPAYTPIDNIVVNCGFDGNSALLGDTRTWIGDVNSKFFSSDFHHNNASIALTALTQPSSAVYATARFSRSEFTYSFPVSPGQKFIRLYFYSASYPNFDRSKAFFSVEAGLYFTLLHGFNASVNADASGKYEMFREFCVCVEGNDEKLNLTFTPANEDSYAFISGIEIVSMPAYLYYTPIDPNDGGLIIRDLKLIGQTNSFFRIENYTSLEMVYRVNTGGNFISPADDTGMYRTWSGDSNLLDGYIYDARLVNTTIHLNYSLIRPYTAPELMYQTAWTMGPNETLNKSYNLTWEYLVDPGFYYMLRLHFCEIEPEINHINDRLFLIYIGDTIAEENADVFRWAGGKGIPYLRDYVVLVPAGSSKKKVNLSVKLQPSRDEWKTRWPSVLLNGIEIFKLNDTKGNLAGENPDPPPIFSPAQTPLFSSNTKSKAVIAVVIPVVVGGLVAMLALGLFVLQRCRTSTDHTSSDGTSWWAIHSISTNKSSKTRNSNLPSDLCRYFSLAEIRAATKNFDEIFIIGVGGFGNVYKGYIDDGGTQVAIKRLKPGSKQGAHEFKTEIEMLSQLRHLHLVSLIGYCNDGNEMILVYDYMSHGTLRSHLYGSDEQPLTWKQRLQICIGAARGLHYLHTGAKHTIIHRDVKTTNILLDEKWVAKVSDFGLSKVGPMNMSKAHISTVVKGSFGYLDPEYYRRQQLTEKSDVYSFGVVLCEVLCARPPLMRLADKKQTYLAEWVQRCAHNNTITQIIDPKIKDEISQECLKKFIEIAVSCIQEEGIKRPSMNDVVWSLEFALQLQDASKKNGGEDGVNGGSCDYEKHDEKEMEEEEESMFSSSVDKTYGSKSMVSSDETMLNSEDSGKGMSGIVFSEIMEPTGR
ncbi:receptor-like protein kinase FERONIA [Benincasa hispida]|uniref:receptor-like protein kinase FERONIA n=1 Tax=Benincasa hispida TaxID=102211 RepID=UPI0018FFAEA8|nr:receptor-like protein kinase FERONIA [Benincasa hispida]